MSLAMVQRYSLEYDKLANNSYMELDPKGRYVLFDEVAPLVSGSIPIDEVGDDPRCNWDWRRCPNPGCDQFVHHFVAVFDDRVFPCQNDACACHREVSPKAD